MAIFSIIVPVYKAENYIRQCIESILQQTFTDFEVLCVDDCGGDNSIHIVEEYAKNDDRIRIFYHSKNLGVAAARNLALENASGKYIFNVDSDDWIDINTLSILYYHFLNSGAESIWFDGYKYYPLDDRLDDKPIHDRKRVGFIDLYPDVLPTFSDMCGMKAYTVESIKRIGLKWPTDIKFDEDGEFYFKYYCHYPRVYSINNCLYYYRKHEESSGASYGRGENSHIVDSYKVIEHLKEYYQERGFYDFYKITLLKLIENRVKFCKNANFSKKNVDATMEFYKNINFPEDYVDYEKEKEPLVSIVVPFYNVEPYIEQCINSLTAQTMRDIDIICVDDCGTDKSMEIVERLAKTDERIKVIHNKQNSGLSESRNNGVRACNAEYIMFCDSDDFFAPDMCEKMYNAITADGADLAICGTEVIYEADHDQKQSDDAYFAVRHNGTMEKDMDIMRWYAVCAWNKIYKREIMTKYDVWFPRGLKYEDEFFYPAYLTYTHKIAFVPEKLYKYRRRAGSIMNTTFSQKHKLNTDSLKIAIAYWDWTATHDSIGDNVDWYWIHMFVKMFEGALNKNTPDNWDTLYDMANDFIKKHYNLNRHKIFE